MLSDDSDVEDVHTLTINEHYAKAFEYRKEREELAKLKEKYGSDVDEEEEDSEEAESEDEDGEELTPALDAAILRTLARIKRKDPSIYELKKSVFEEERQRTADVELLSARGHKGKDKSKPLTLRQHALASALEDASNSRSSSPEPLTHVEEQKHLRQKTITAFHTAVVGNGAEADDDDDLLVPRDKTKDEIEQENEEYRAFLQREVGEDLSGLITVEAQPGKDDVGGDEEAAPQADSLRKKNKSKAKTESAKSKREEDHEFLMNYILNRGWIDPSARRLPTYKEITSTSKGKGKAVADSEEEQGSSSAGSSAEENDNASLDEDEFDDVADRFESSYNFRFEEPGAAEIARHPRNLPSIVRRQDTSRKEAREKRKARKEEELLKKKEEVKRLKALKMKELKAKLERIGLEGGKELSESAALQALDLEGDWDPHAHDQQMAQLYDEDDEPGLADGDIVDEEKPTWDDDIDITDIVPPRDEGSKKKKRKKKKDDLDTMAEGGVNVDDMDADVSRATNDHEEWDGTEEMRKRKVDEYMDEVYALDFNDIVGGMPMRFHYTKVDQQNFGLTPAEVLMATDAELNTYMGIKKYAPYRKEGKGRNWDGKRTARLKELKDSLKERGADDDSTRQGFELTEKKKRKGKKERMREKAATLEGVQDEESGNVDVDMPKTEKRKREENQSGDDNAKRKRRRHRKTVASGA